MKTQKFLFFGTLIMVMAFAAVLAGCASAGGTSGGGKPSPQAAQLAASLNAINSGSAAANGDTVTLTKTIAVQTHLTVPSGVTLELTGDGGLRLNNATLTVDGSVNAPGGKISMDSGESVINGSGTITLLSKGALLEARGAERRHTLDGVTLIGIADNDSSLVRVSGGAELTLKSGVIKGNTTSGDGGGVSVAGESRFYMSGGEISGNRAGSHGGGVSVAEKGTFGMLDGAIFGNSAGGSGGAVGRLGTFIMAGGVIWGNTGQHSCVGTGGMFIMAGGRIQGSTDSDGFTKNTVTANDGHVIGRSGNAGTIVLKWSEGGTYTKGGVPQTGGSNIGETNDTLAAIPAKLLFPENMLGHWIKDAASLEISFSNKENISQWAHVPYGVIWSETLPSTAGLHEVSGNTYSLNPAHPEGGRYTKRLVFTAQVGADGKLTISGAKEVAYGTNTVSWFSGTSRSVDEMNGTYTKK
jgi:hypothetical protein